MNPGDIIVGDRNGVIVLHPEEAEEVMERAQDKRMRQETAVKRMKETGEVIPKISPNK